MGAVCTTESYHSTSNWKQIKVDEILSPKQTENQVGSNAKMSIWLFGLTGSGKSSILQGLRFPSPGVVPLCSPTRNVSAYECTLGSTCTALVDTPGKRSSTSRAYKVHADKLLYVVDASSPRTLQLARVDLDNLLRSIPQSRDLPLLIVLSKTDRKEAVTKRELISEMQLSRKYNKADINGLNHPCCTVVRCSLLNAASLAVVKDFLGSSPEGFRSKHRLKLLS